LAHYVPCTRRTFLLPKAKSKVMGIIASAAPAFRRNRIGLKKELKTEKKGIVYQVEKS